MRKAAKILNIGSNCHTLLPGPALPPPTPVALLQAAVAALTDKLARAAQACASPSPSALQTATPPPRVKLHQVSTCRSF